MDSANSFFPSHCRRRRADRAERTARPLPCYAGPPHFPSTRATKTDLRVPNCLDSCPPSAIVDTNIRPPAPQFNDGKTWLLSLSTLSQHCGRAIRTIVRVPTWCEVGARMTTLSIKLCNFFARNSIQFAKILEIR